MCERRIHKIFLFQGLCSIFANSSEGVNASIKGKNVNRQTALFVAQFHHVRAILLEELYGHLVVALRSHVAGG